MNAPGTNTADAAWSAFAGTTATVNDRPDKFYCRVCGGIWSSRAPANGKRGMVGYNRCGGCGCRYADDHLFRLKKPTDTSIHLLADGICVSVQRTMLASVWQNFAASPVNHRLATEQGVDVSTLPATVIPAATVATVALAGTDAPSTATSDPADWDAFARSDR